MTKDYAKAITKIKQWKPSKDAVTIDSFAIYIGFTVYDNEGNEYGDQGAVLDFFQLLKKDANFIAREEEVMDRKDCGLH